MTLRDQVRERIEALKGQVAQLSEPPWEPYDKTSPNLALCALRNAAPAMLEDSGGIEVSEFDMEMPDCRICGAKYHPHQTCEQANMTDEEIRCALIAEREDGCVISVGGLICDLEKMPARSDASESETTSAPTESHGQEYVCPICLPHEQSSCPSRLRINRNKEDQAIQNAKEGRG